VPFESQISATIDRQLSTKSRRQVWEKDMLQKGQKVRLNYRGVKFHLSTLKQLPCDKWDSRIGRIGRLSRNGTHAFIVWDGNRSASDACR
jgi:hypothetical protein